MHDNFTYTVTRIIAVGFSALHERDVSAVEIRIFFKRAIFYFMHFISFNYYYCDTTFVPVLLK